jgi:two-component system chemotaxis response regulator CheB
MRRDLIVIGGSAGALPNLQSLLPRLAPDLPAAVAIVVHRSATGGVLDALLGRSAARPVVEPHPAVPIRPGIIAVAPADRHLVVTAAELRTERGPRENLHRPSIDVLFRSAARARGPRVIALLLSGTRDDGVAGLRAIRDHGGVAIVLSPEDAAFPTLPEAAIDAGEVDRVVRLGELDAVLGALLDVELPPSAAAFVPEPPPPLLPPIAYTCPDCGGTLQESDGELSFRCHVGHAYSADFLAEAQGERVEHAVYAGMAALEELAALSRRIAHRATQRGHADLAKRYELRAARALANADRLRAIIQEDRPDES